MTMLNLIDILLWNWTRQVNFLRPSLNAQGLIFLAYPLDGGRRPSGLQGENVGLLGAKAWHGQIKSAALSLWIWGITGGYVPAGQHCLLKTVRLMICTWSQSALKGSVNMVVTEQDYALVTNRVYEVQAESSWLAHCCKGVLCTH